MPAFPDLLHEPSWRGAWRILFVMLIGTVTWLALSPNESPVQLSRYDKIEHALAFAALGTAAALGGVGSRRVIALSAVGLLMYGGLIELAQTRIAGRSGEWADWLADAIGIACGLLLAAWTRRRWPPARP